MAVLLRLIINKVRDIQTGRYLDVFFDMHFQPAIINSVG